MKNIPFPSLALFSGLVLMAGCATANSMQDARASLEKAKAAGAETRAPADYYMAAEYFRMAEHETQEGDASQASEMAAKSLNHSEQAIRKAGGGMK